MTNIISISIAVFSLLLTIYWKKDEARKYNTRTSNSILEITRLMIDINTDILTCFKQVKNNPMGRDEYSNLTFWLVKTVNQRSKIDRLGHMIDALNLHENKYAYEANEIYSYYDRLIDMIVQMDDALHKANRMKYHTFDDLTAWLADYFSGIENGFLTTRYEDHINNINEFLCDMNELEKKAIMEIFINRSTHDIKKSL